MRSDLRTERARAQQRSLPVAVALGITTTVSYGTLYYAFGVVAAEMAADTGLSLTSVYGLFSASLAGAAVAAPFTGRALDRFLPAGVMAAGSLCSAVMLALLAITPGALAFAVFLVGAQMAATMVLYDSAFTVATAHVRGQSRRTITIITLIAGFASTVFWPLTIRLGESMSWREVYLIFALLHLVVCTPLHLWLSGMSARKEHQPIRIGGDEKVTIGRLEGGGPGREAFNLMLCVFAVSGFTISAVHLHLIGLLGELGLAASAAMIGALIGPAQVAGRLVEFFSGGRMPALRIMVFSNLALLTGLLILVAGPAHVAIAAVAAAVFGLGQGVIYIVRGILPPELFGSRGYGAMLGRFNAASLTMMAVAPVLTAAIREAYDARTAVMVIMGVSACGVAAALRLMAIIRSWEGRPDQP